MLINFRTDFSIVVLTSVVGWIRWMIFFCIYSILLRLINTAYTWNIFSTHSLMIWQFVNMILSQNIVLKAMTIVRIGVNSLKVETLRIIYHIFLRLLNVGQILFFLIVWLVLSLLRIIVCVKYCFTVFQLRMLIDFVNLDIFV